jgi:selenide,water dikinase
VDWGELTEPEQLVLADAQTSGGLLISISEDRAVTLRGALHSRGIAADEVGVVQHGDAGRIKVRGRVTV